MKAIASLTMLLNAALFLFGAFQHVGLAFGALREPVLIPAAILEGICAGALIWGACALLGQSSDVWKAAVIGNMLALTGLLAVMFALTAGAIPRTSSNDLYHRLTLLLIAIALGLLWGMRGAMRRMA